MTDDERHQIRLPITYRAYNSGGKGGQHFNRSLNAMEASVTMPDGRRIVAASSSHKSQYRNKAIAERVLVARVRIAIEPESERRTGGERVRTYHAVRNEVIDYASGERCAYVEVIDGDAFGELVDARRRAKAIEEATDR